MKKNKMNYVEELQTKLQEDLNLSRFTIIKEISNSNNYSSSIFKFNCMRK